MKAKDITRILRDVTCFLLLSQTAYCHLYSTTNSHFCCEKSPKANNFSCWNGTLGQNRTGNVASSFDKCKQNDNNICFNVTAVTPCRTDNLSGSMVDTERKMKIHIGAFVPFLKSDKYGHAAAMKMAIDFINNRSDILENYTLVLDFEDTGWASGAHAIKAFFNLLNKKQDPVILLGPSNTESLEPIAEAAPKWNLVQVSYASGSPKFESDLTYPNTYRASPSTTSYSKAKAAFIKHFGWNRVAILHEYDPEFFSPTVDKLKTELENKNISIIAVEGFEKSGDVSFQMEKMKALDARIIIGEFSWIGARNVFCEAFKKKMFGSHYAWIIFGEFPTRKLFDNDSKLSCTSHDLKQAADRYIATIKLDIRQDNNHTISGMTSEDYWNKLRHHKSTKKRTLRKDSAYAFDAAWVIALALNASFASGTTYDKLLHRDSAQVFQIKDGIEKANFQGLTGSVRFDQNRERMGTVLLKQNRQGKEFRIGQHFTFSGQFHIFESQEDKIWEDNRPPKDHTVQTLELMMSPLPLIIIMWIAAVLGVICSLSFLYFNITYGKKGVIKMSSPKLNNIIIVGCILCYVSVILFGLDARFLDFKGYGINCNARAVVLSLGFSLSFGALFSKTWRVHKIFTAAKSLKKMVIKDLHLLGIVAGLVAVDVVFFSGWIVVDPLRAEKLTFKELGLLLLFGLFLAWETRNVSIPALNDAKYIGMSVYNVFVLVTIGVIVAVALDGSKYHEAKYAISSLCHILCTTATLLLVFVPKISQFFMKDENTTKQPPTMHSSKVMRSRTQSHSLICTSPVLQERHNSLMANKATQTELDVPGSAGTSGENSIKKNQNSSRK